MAIALVLVSGVVAPAAHATVPTSRLGAPSECGCDKTGPFKNPHKGVLPAVVQTSSPTVGTSSKGAYRVEYTTSGTQTRVLVIRVADGQVRLDTTMTGDVGGGFSPDEHRFSSVNITGGAGKQFTTMTLWDLEAGRNVSVWQEQVPSGNAQAAYSKQGRYFMFAGVTGPNQMALRLIDTRRGAGAQRVRHSADILYTPPPADEPEDVYGVIRWGWSGDDNDRSFAYGYITGQNSYNLVVANLASGASRTESGLDISAFWQFSPCGDALVKVAQPSPNFLSASLLRLATMEPPVHKDGIPFGYAEIYATASEHKLRVTKGTTPSEMLLASHTTRQRCVRSVTVAPSEVGGGASATGTVHLASPAPPDGFLVALTSSDPSKATVPPSVNVPPGLSSATFSISTTDVTSRTSISIGASAAPPPSDDPQLPDPPHASAVFVVRPNTPPTARFSGTTQTYAGVNATFTDASTDSDGEVVAWLWEFGDGNSGSGRRVDHRYEEAGTYTVTLTVVDDKGARASASRHIVIDPNQPPVASFTISPDPPQTGALVTATSTSTDPDDGIAEYEWQFGGKVLSEEPTAEVRLTCGGPLQLTVTDTAGNSSTTTLPLGSGPTEVPGSAVPVADLAFPDSEEAQGHWSNNPPVARTAVQLNSFCEDDTFGSHEGQSAVTGPVNHGSYGEARVDLPVEAAQPETISALAGVDVTAADVLGQDAFAGHSAGQLYRVTGPASHVPVELKAVVSYEVHSTSSRATGEPAQVAAWERIRWSLSPLCDGYCGEVAEVTVSGDAWSGGNWYGDASSSSANVYVGDGSATIHREDVYNWDNEAALAGQAVVPISVTPGTFLRSGTTYDATAYATGPCVDRCTAQGSVALRVTFEAVDPRFSVVPLAGLGPDGGDPEDLIAPEVTAVPERQPDLGDWYSSSVLIDWLAIDPYPSRTGVASTPSPVLASSEGRHTYVSEPSCDTDGNCAQGSISIAIDAVAPDVTITRATREVDEIEQSLGLHLGLPSPPARSTLSGTASDTTSGVTAVLVEATYGDGQVRTFTADCPGCGVGDATWTLDTARLGRGTQSVVAVGVDAAGNTSRTRSLTVHQF